MLLQKHSNTTEKPKVPTGFTLVEVLIAVVLLALIASGISYPYIVGLQALDVKADRMLLDSQLRSRMEVLISTDFDSLSEGFEVISINGQNYTITWTVVPVDLDGNDLPEPTAMLVTVSVTEIPGHSLSSILVDNEDRVGKVS